MNTYQKIRAIEEKLDNGQERNACITAERILFNAVAIRVHRVTAEDFINTLDGKPVKKEKLDLTEAMEAQKTIHQFGERFDIDIPIIEDEDEFLYWLMRDYGLSTLMHT